MDLNALVETIANEADSFLEGVVSRTEARVAIIEHLSEAYPNLPESSRKPIVDGVMSILEDEEFFSVSQSSGEWDEGEGGDPE